MKFRVLQVVGIATLAATQLFAQQTVYSNIPGTLQGNYGSIGYEATQTTEFGNLLHLAPGARALSQISVVMSNWALASEHPLLALANPAGFYHSITANVYSVSGAAGVGSLLGSVTTSQLQLWRPEASAECVPPRWYSAADDSCYSGYAYRNTYNFSSLGITLPDDIIVTLAYSTDHYGPDAANLGAGPWNSLNFAIGSSPTLIGSNPINTMYGAGSYWLPGDAVARAQLQEDPLFWEDFDTDPSGNTFYAAQIEVEATPEPASLVLIATGLAGVAAVARRRRHS